MSSTNTTKTLSRRELRSFGLIMTGGFLFIAVAPMIIRKHAPSEWAGVISLLFAAATIFVPGALRVPQGLWMKLGHVLGWINSKIILSAVYYIVVTPIRLLMKIVGYDPMNRHFDKQIKTYRIPRKARPASHVKHQF